MSHCADGVIAVRRVRPERYVQQSLHGLLSAERRLDNPAPLKVGRPLGDGQVVANAFRLDALLILLDETTRSEMIDQEEFVSQGGDRLLQSVCGGCLARQHGAVALEY